MIKILKQILLLVFFFLSFNQVEAQGAKCLYPSFAQDFKNADKNSGFLEFCKNHKDPLAQYEALFNTGALFNKLSGATKIGLKTKILENLNTAEIPRLATSLKDLSSQRLVTVLNEISSKGLKEVIKDPNISGVWGLVLKEFPKIGVKEKNLETFLNLRFRGKAFFDDAIRLVKDSNAKQKLIDNLKKADGVFKNNIQNIKYTASKLPGEVKIVNKHTNELVAIITNGKLEKKKFLTSGQGTPIGDKRYKLFEDGSLVGFAKPASKRGKYGDDFYATVGVEIEKVTNSGLIKKATKWQGQGAYPGVDDWEVYKIKAGTKIYGGLPGQSEFYSTLDNLQDAGFSKVKFWESLQVKSHATHGFRPKVGEYVIKKDIEVAISRTLANPQYGKGGGWQVFVDDFANDLRFIKEIQLK